MASPGRSPNVAVQSRGEGAVAVLGVAPPHATAKRPTKNIARAGTEGASLTWRRPDFTVQRNAARPSRHWSARAGGTPFALRPGPATSTQAATLTAYGLVASRRSVCDERAGVELPALAVHELSELIERGHARLLGSKRVIPREHDRGLPVR